MSVKVSRTRRKRMAKFEGYDFYSEGGKMLAKHDPEIQIQTITPAEAIVFLGKNTNNRGVRQGTVEKYARDMQAGDWHFTGDPIRFNGDGSLLDGQHRLLACVKANTSFKTAVIRGLATADRAVLDTGAKRSLTDVLKWQGEANQALLASTMTWCVRYELGRMRDHKLYVSHSELLGWLEQNPGIRESLPIARQTREQVPIPATILGGVHYELSKLDEGDARGFMAELKAGTGLAEGSPILALRKFAFGTETRRERPSQVVYSAVTIKAVNAWREGRNMTVARWRAGGARGEEFPSLEDAAV